MYGVCAQDTTAVKVQLCEESQVRPNNLPAYSAIKTYRILRILLEWDSKRVSGIDPTPRHGAEEDPDGTLAGASGHSVVVIGRAQQDERVDRHVHHIVGGHRRTRGCVGRVGWAHCHGALVDHCCLGCDEKPKEGAGVLRVLLSIGKRTLPDFLWWWWCRPAKYSLNLSIIK